VQLTGSGFYIYILNHLSSRHKGSLRKKLGAQVERNKGQRGAGNTTQDKGKDKDKGGGATQWTPLCLQKLHFKF